jgi:hypothetical protein
MEVYAFRWNDHFKYANHLMMNVMVPPVYKHYSVTTPLLISREFGKIFDRFTDVRTLRMRYNIFTLYYNYATMENLPPPYDTMCTDNEKEAKDVCVQECTIREMAKHNRVPTTEIILEPLDHKIITFDEYEDPAILKLVLDTEKKCRSLCKKQLCHYDFTNTMVYPSLIEDFQFSSRFNVMTSTGPTMKVTKFPAMTFIDLFVYISSAFGVWFGLSMRTFDPSQVIKGDPPPLPKREIVFVKKHHRCKTHKIYC